MPADVNNDGTNDVVILFDGNSAGDTEVPLNALKLEFAPPVGQGEAIEIAYDGLGGTNVLEITGDAGPIELEQYDSANNTITFTQQYLIMRSQGYKPDVFGNIKSSLSRSSKTGQK